MPPPPPFPPSHTHTPSFLAVQSCGGACLLSWETLGSCAFFDAGSAKRGALIFFFVLFMLLLPFFLLEAYYKLKYRQYLGALLQIVIYLMLAVYEVPSPTLCNVVSL